MTILTVDEILDQLKSQYPDIVCRPTREQYREVTLDEIVWFVTTFPARSNNGTTNICADNATRFMVQVKDYCLDHGDVESPAIGTVDLTMVQGVEKMHTTNFFVVEGEIYLCDIQDGGWWLADPELDKIYFIGM